MANKQPGAASGGIFGPGGRPSGDVLLQYFTHGPTPARIVGADFLLLGQNPAMDRLCMLMYDRTAPRRCFEVIRAPALCRTAGCPLTRIMSGEPLVEAHCRRETWSGREFPGRVLAVPLRDKAGAVVGMIEITIDESDIVALNSRLEEKNRGLEESTRRLGAYSEIIRALNRETDPIRLAGTALELVCRHGSAVLGVVLLRDRDTATLSPLATHAMDGPVPSLHIGQGPAGQTAADGTVRFLAEMPAERWRVRCGCGEGRPASLAFLPLRVHGEVIGVLELGGFSPLEDQGEFLLDIADELAVALRHALARREIERFVEKLQEQNEELQSQSEELIAQSEEIQSQAEEIEAQRDDLERKTIEAEEANRLKSVFLANMSHELRTPLNALLGLASLLAQGRAGALSPMQAKYIEVIHRNGTLLLGQLDGILDLSRIEAGREDLRFDEIHLKGFLDTFAATMRTLAEQKELAFEVRLEGEAGTMVSDERKLLQVLTNLVSNAIKFTERGGVVLLLAPYREEGQDWVRFSVEDTGIGIPAGCEKLIFEPFRQADESSSRRFGGSGLGLSIAKKIVEYLGGRIRLCSREGEGSVFIVELPRDRRFRLKPPDEARQALLREELLSAAAEAGPAVLPPAAPAAGGRILVVDDDIVAVRELGLGLRRAGYQVSAAFNGQTGLEILKKERPRLVVLEPEMVVLDGYALLAGMAEVPELAAIPVLVLGRNIGDPRRLAPFGRLVRGVLHKGNITEGELLAEISRILGKPVRGKPASPPETASPHAPPTEGTKAGTLLVVEDNPDNLFLVLEILRGAGHACVTAANGQEAVARARDSAPVLILMDVQMPGMSGEEAAGLIRRAVGPAAPIIALTARAMKGDREDLLDRGFDDYLAKPVSPEALLAMVDKWLGRNER